VDLGGVGRGRGGEVDVLCGWTPSGSSSEPSGRVLAWISMPKATPITSNIRGSSKALYRGRDEEERDVQSCDKLLAKLRELLICSKLREIKRVIRRCPWGDMFCVLAFCMNDGSAKYGWVLGLAANLPSRFGSAKIPPKPPPILSAAGKEGQSRLANIIRESYI